MLTLFNPVFIERYAVMEADKMDKMKEMIDQDPAFFPI